MGSRSVLNKLPISNLVGWRICKELISLERSITADFPAYNTLFIDSDLQLVLSEEIQAIFSIENSKAVITKYSNKNNTRNLFENKLDINRCILFQQNILSGEVPFDKEFLMKFYQIINTSVLPPKKYMNLVLKLDRAMKEFRELLPVPVFTAVYIYEFLTLPYYKGNELLASLLTKLLWQETEYQFAVYIPLWKYFAEDKKRYLRALRTAQLRHNTPFENISEWIFFFLEKLQVGMQELKRTAITPVLHPRRKEVLEFIRKNGPVNFRQLEEGLSHINRNTLKKDIQELKKSGLIFSQGANRRTMVYFAKNF